MNEEGRREAVARALKAADESSDIERVRVPWRDEQATRVVVKLPLEAVVLNPNSHRIRSQLESHPDRDVVRPDPFGEEAQALLASLLRATEGYVDLLNDLREYGQRDYGVATAVGVLVNANTRAVALRELDPHGHIRVATLPADASAKDIARLELQLQVKRDLKQDYTFSNELLFIEEMKREYGFTDEETAKELGWAASSEPREIEKGAKRVRQSTRTLAMIQELRNRSGETLPLTFFDDKRQHLTDLDDAYESLKTTDPLGAELLKETRLLGILGGTYYRELRKVKPDMIGEYVIPSLSEQETIKPMFAPIIESELTSADRPEGLALLGGDGDGSDQLDSQRVTAQVRAFVSVLAKSQGQEEVRIPTAQGHVTVGREAFVSAVAEALDDSVSLADADEKSEKSLEGPLKLIKDARHKTQKGLEAFSKVHSRDGFESGKFKFEVRKLATAVEALKKELEKTETDG